MTSPNRIVCGTELSEVDRALADTAADLARVLSAELVLVHASAPPPEGASAVPDSVRDAARQLERRVQSERTREGDALAYEALRLRQPSVSIRAVQVDGRPHEALVDIADAKDDSLLVVGARPRKPLGRTVDHVVRHTRSPVLAVPPGAPPLAQGLVSVVAFDGSEAAMRALVLAADLTARLGGAIAIIHACGPAEVDEERRRIESLLRAHAPSLLGPDSVLAVPIETNVPDAILREATRRHAALVAVGSHGRRGLARAILGSTPEAILHRAATAVLIVR